MLLNILHQYDKDNSKKPGFGDFLKGCAFLYQQQEIYNFNLDINFSKHPIGNFITSTVINKELINIPQIDLLNNSNFFNLFKSNGNYNIICNNFYDVPINENVKNYMKNNVLNFKDEFLSEFNSILYNLNLNSKNYNIIHIRTTDNNFTRNTNIPDIVSKFIDNNFLKSQNILLISNNYSLKINIKNKYPNIKITNYEPIHLGVCSKDLINTNYDLLDIKNTLIEFLFLINSKDIYTYSEYNNYSAFSKTASDIYDIPIYYIK